MKDIDHLELRTTIVEAIYEWQHPIICEACSMPILSHHRFRIKQTPVIYDQTDTTSLAMHMNCDNPTFDAHDVTGESIRTKDGDRYKLERSRK